MRTKQEFIARSFNEMSVVKHALAVDSNDTPAVWGDVAMVNGKPVVLNQHLYCCFMPREEDKDDLESIYLTPAVRQIARTFDSIVMSMVHRMPLHSKQLTPRLIRGCKRDMVDPVLFVNPFTEADYLTDGDPDLLRSLPPCMTLGLPYVEIGNVNPTRVARADGYQGYVDVYIQEDGPIKCGQSLTIGTGIFTVVEVEVLGEILGEVLQRLYLDSEVLVTEGEAVFPGIGLYNLLMDRGAITAVSRPECGKDGFFHDGLYYNYYRDGGDLTISLLLGFQLTHPERTIAIKG